MYMPMSVKPAFLDRRRGFFDLLLFRFFFTFFTCTTPKKLFVELLMLEVRSAV